MKLTRRQIALRCAALATFTGLPLVGRSQAADLPQLVAAAKKEGEVLFYITATEQIARRVADAFTAKYGIKANFVRLPGVQSVTRFGTEAQAGTFAADAYFSGGNVLVSAKEFVAKGWLVPIEQADLPVVKNGDFPARFITGPVATVQIAPWGIAYNRDLLKGGRIPKDWPDVLDPAFKGKLIVPEVRGSDSFPPFWAAIAGKYGESFLTKLRDLQPRTYPSGVPASNGLAAGEGAVHVPSVAYQIEGLKDKGAPLGIVIPEFTTGLEIAMALVHPRKAPHPNAGRLFANFVMSREGNAVFNGDPGSISVYDTSSLPKQYQAPNHDEVQRKDVYVRLLGQK